MSYKDENREQSKWTLEEVINPFDSYHHIPDNLAKLIPESELKTCPETAGFQKKQQMMLKNLEVKQERLLELQETFWDLEDEEELDENEISACSGDGENREEAEEKIINIHNRREKRELAIERLKEEILNDLELLDGAVNMKEITYLRERKIYLNAS